MINKFDFKDTDTRVRKYIVPTRIVTKSEDIQNAECILKYRDRQIQLQETELMIMPAHSHIVLDFGYEFHGGAQISVYKNSGKTNVSLHLRFGESVGEALAPLGFKGACNDHSARDLHVDVMPYSSNEYALTGYRFLYIENESEVEVKIKTVQGIVIYQPYEYIGGFECSDKRLNEIYDVSAYTCHLCMQNQLWDGIKRDRLVWIGDMSPELKTIKYVFGDSPEIESGLRLSAEDAALPKWVNTIPTYSLWWLINLEEWCAYKNDYSLMDKMKGYVIPLIHQIVKNTDENGNFLPGTFIDWPTKVAKESKEGTRALLILCMRACIKICARYGEAELEKVCKDTEARAGRDAGDPGQFKQIAALLYLAGIADKKSEEVLKNGGANGFSTFMSYYILTAMAKVTDTDRVLSALSEYYGGMLDMGATTFWEDFDIKWTENACRIDEIPNDRQSDVHGDNGNYCYLGYRHSLCHGWASGPVAFLTEHVLGIEFVQGDPQKIRISPNLGSLEYAKGSVATPFGKVTVSHTKQKDGSIKTVIDAPEKIEIL